MNIQSRKTLILAFFSHFVVMPAFSQADIPSTDEVQDKANEAASDKQQEVENKADEAKQEAADKAQEAKDKANEAQNNAEEKKQELTDEAQQGKDKLDKANNKKEELKAKLGKKKKGEPVAPTPEEYQLATPEKLRNNLHVEMSLGLGIGVAKDVKNTQFETDYANFAISTGFAFNPLKPTFLPGPVKPFGEFTYQTATGVYTIESPDITGAKESSAIIHYVMIGGGARTFLPKLPKLILSANAKLGITWVTTVRYGQNDTHKENEREVEKIGAALALNFNAGYKVWEKIQAVGGINTNIGTHSLYTFTVGVRSLF